MYGLWPVPFKDGCAAASMNRSSEYEVILLTSEGPKTRCEREVGWHDRSYGEFGLVQRRGKKGVPPGAKARRFSIAFDTTESRALIQSPVLMQTRNPVGV